MPQFSNDPKIDDLEQTYAQHLLSLACERATGDYPSWPMTTPRVCRLVEYVTGQTVTEAEMLEAVASKPDGPVVAGEIEMIGEGIDLTPAWYPSDIAWAMPNAN